MSKLPTAEIDDKGSGAGASGEPSVLDVAENREPFAPPETVLEIADWVNEGGAGGEVKR